MSPPSPGRPCSTRFGSAPAFAVGLFALLSSELVNLLTLAAEVGGVAIVLQLLSGLPYRVLLVLAIVGLAIVIWTIKLDWIERIFGYGGLCMIVFASRR